MNISRIVLSFLIFAFPALNLSAQWEHASGPLVYPVTSVAFTGNTILAATTNGEIYFSQSGAETWESVGGVPNLNSESYTLAATDSVVFAGYQYGMYTSHDGGRSWQNADTVFGTGVKASVYSLAVNGGEIFAGLFNGLYVSTDNGSTWEPSGLLGTQVNAILATNVGIFAGTAGGIFYSRDGGNSWGTSTSASGISPKQFAVADSVLFAENGQAVYRSTDGGVNWTVADSGIKNTLIMCLAASGNSVFAGTNGGAFVTTNNGESWNPVSNGLPDTSIYSLTSNGATFGAGTSIGFYLSGNNGMSWSPAGLNISPMNGTAEVDALVALGQYLVAGVSDYANAVYRSTDNGTTWPARPVLNSSIYKFFTDGRNILISDRGVYTSSDSGSTWTKISDQDIGGFASADDTIYGVSDKAIYLSSDLGHTWSSMALLPSQLSSVAVDGRYILAGGSDVIYRSTDQGATWTSFSPNFVNANFNSFITSGANLLAGSTGGILSSPDSGKTWVQLGYKNGLTDTTIAGFTAKGENIFAATRSNVFLSTDHGDTWNSVGEGLPNSPEILCVAANNTYLFVGSRSRGVWRRPLWEMITGIARDRDPVPVRFSLDQNYPNPFNPTTTIGYAIAKSAHVTLRVYDALGREVRTLVDEIQQAGKYEVKFDGSLLASGIYFYRLTAGSSVFTKKLLLLK